MVWDRIQAEFHCCGVEGPSDYSKDKIPPSCCGTGSSNSSCSETNAHKTGCYKVMKDFLQKNDVIIASIAGVVGVCQIIASASAFWLAQTIKKNNAGFSAYGAPPPQGAQAPPRM